LKLKKQHKLIIAADGSAASGKTTGAKIISKKYGLHFLSSGLLYRYASFQLLKNKPKNKIIFLKKCFKTFNLKKLDNKKLHSPKISAHTSIIAKEQKIRIVLKSFGVTKGSYTILLIFLSIFFASAVIIQPLFFAFQFYFLTKKNNEKIYSYSNSC